MEPAGRLSSPYPDIVPEDEAKGKRNTESRPPPSVQEPPQKKLKTFDLNVIRKQMVTCFGEKSIQKIGNIENVSLEFLAEKSFECTNKRLLSPKCVTSLQITNIHKLFFETDLKETSENMMLGNMDPVNPHPTYVFKSLFSCMEALAPYGITCTKAHEATTRYLATKPKPKEILEGILALNEEDKKRILPILEGDQANLPFLSEYKEYLSEAEKFEKGLKKFPIISTHDLFPNRIVKNKNETYLFCNKDGLGQWIFKPIMKDKWAANFPMLASREHAASCVNFHHQFPIPKTIFVEINGWKGSAQIYLSNTKSFEEVQRKQLPCSKIFLQKLVIYDLLFSNCDRHEDNLLFKKIMEQLEYQAYGIDHDRCMQGFVEPLKLKYLDPIKNDHFTNTEELLLLISRENLDQYIKMMRDCKMDDEAVVWLEEVSVILEEAIKNEKNIINTVDEVMKQWDQH